MDSEIQGRTWPFLMFWAGFRVFGEYFNGFLGLCSAILPYFCAILCYFTQFSGILHYFTLIFDSMISYLKLISS